MASYYTKKSPTLLRGITSKYHGNFHCLNCLHSFAAKNKHESHKKVCKNKDFCNVVMPSQDTKMLKLKSTFIIYADLACLIVKIDECKNNPEN